MTSPMMPLIFSELKSPIQNMPFLRVVDEPFYAFGDILNFGGQIIEVTTFIPLSQV